MLVCVVRISQPFVRNVFGISNPATEMPKLIAHERRARTRNPRKGMRAEIDTLNQKSIHIQSLEINSSNPSTEIEPTIATVCSKGGYE